MNTTFYSMGCLRLALIEQIDIVTMLSITVAVFLILLILGIRKTYKLKAENDRLSKLNPLDSDDEKDKRYKDFQDGHLYE
ncbi:MAG: hypothetical protein R2802_02630 [Flavobacteriaceae bacterium]|nr:hypothetical protein [Mangrovimonas sp.]MCB0470428.1 hypothetical protein [Flavobacteriaceae bacterium]MCB0426969.1 hypothetical protein [Mangrovimonas sp.]MCB0432399.1 hypothetical protein [Mangrovimonas sp.]MCB0435794.1 hypothetical protein [Mangrovimonas sp.]